MTNGNHPTPSTVATNGNHSKPNKPGEPKPAEKDKASTEPAKG
ncbi:MAG: hypothetical protein AAGH88_03365 [Planctomycetota bacterium]